MAELDDQDVLRQRIVAEIEANGPLPFSRFMERALYEPNLGFYEARGRAGGRRGDFVTSVETGTLFAALVGEWLTCTWEELGRPDPFIVVEAGAGVGTLWRGIHRAQPNCFAALEYCLIERSAEQRRVHADLPGAPRSLTGLPETPVHVILANELLDNLAFDIAYATADGDWVELRVAGERGDLAFAPDAAVDAATGAQLAGLAAPAGATVAIPTGANQWLKVATKQAEVVLCLDYTATHDQMIERRTSGWLRTYDGHQRGHDPFVAPGSADITHDVPVDLLDPAPTNRRNQADFLRACGIAELVAAARSSWEERRHIGDLDALFARSAVTEADALMDPNGLGGFTVLEWRSRAQNGANPTV